MAEATTAEPAVRPVSLLRNRLLLAVSFGHFASDTYANLLPVMYPLLMSSLGLNYGKVGLIGTLSSATGSLSQPLFGFLADRVPSRLLAAGGIAWAAVLMSLVGFTWDYPSLLVTTCLAALGIGAFHPQGAMNASLTSGSQRASGVSIFMLGGTVGFALAPLLAASILSNLGLRGSAVLILPGLLAAWLVWVAMRRQEIPRGRLPAGLGLWSDVPVGRMALVVLVVAMRAWAYQGVVVYVPLLMTARGYSLAVASQVLFVVLLGASAGMLAGGLLADRVGRLRTIAVTLALAAPATLLFLHTDLPLGVLMGVAFGFLADASHPATVVMAQEMMPRSTGLASGLVLGLAFVTGGLGTWVTGVLADGMGLVGAMSTLAVFPAMAALLSLFLRTAATRAPKPE